MVRKLHYLCYEKETIMNTFFKSFLKSVTYPLIRFYFGLRSYGPLWLYVFNRKGRRLYIHHAPVLDVVQKKIVQDLQRDGIASIHIDELFPDRKLLPLLQEYVSKEIHRAEIKMQKKYLKQIWDLVPLVDFKNALMTLCIDPRVVDIVNSYMGLCSRFYYLTLNITTPVGHDAAAVASQRWHRDPEDKRMCKIFLYLNDVDDTSGPFQYVVGSHYSGPYATYFPQHPPKGTCPGDDHVDKVIPRSAMKSYTGRAGTLIFADTIGLHKGGYATRKERIMFTGGFCSSASVWPIRLRYASDFNERLVRVHPRVAFALKPISRSFSTKLFDRIRKVYTYE